MKTMILKTAAVLGLMSVAACGGSGGTGGTVTPPTGTGTGPASNSSADLLDYVVSGGTAIAHSYSDNNNLTRLQRSENVNGEQVTVTVDRLADGTYGLIQYVRGTDATLYSLDDGLVASTNVPDGQYTGAFDVSYSTDGGASWDVGVGDATVVIDTTTGQADFGGMATAQTGGGNTNSVEFYSTASLVNGEFSDNGASVVYRENGTLVSSHTGSVDGMTIGSGADSGVVGLVGADDGNFQADGGFTLTPYNP